MDPEGLERLQGPKQVRNGPCKAVKLPNDHDIKAATVWFGHQAIEFRSLFFGATDSQVHIFPGDTPPAAIAILAKFARLSLCEFGIYAVIHIQADYRTGIWRGSAARILATAPRGASLRQIQRAIKHLEDLRYLKSFRVQGARGNTPYVIDKFTVRSGALKGYRLNAAKSESWQRPFYEFVAEVVTEDDAVPVAEHDALSRSKKEEVRKKSLAKTSQPLKDIAQIILDTGLRPEEVFRIRIENLDFGERTIFNPFGKTKAARRKVTMTADVSELLKRRLKKSKGPFVFPAKSSSERPIGSVRKAHDAAVENAGIKEHFRLYDLRHTFATRAVAAGVDLPTLSAILGHTSIQMTMRYVHPAEEQKRSAVKKFETFRLAGTVEAMEKSRQATTISATVQ